MNRQQRRSADKKARKKLTDDQFNKFKDLASEEAINIEVDRRLNEMFHKLTGDLAIAMREHRISEDRILKIVKRTVELGKERQKENERLS